MYLITKPSGLIIRDMVEGDIPALTHLLNTDEVSRFMTYLRPMKIEDVTAWFHMQGELKYVIEKQEPYYGVIGQITMFDPDKDYEYTDGVELACFVSPYFTKMGYAQEAISAVISFFEVTLGSVIFYAVVAKANSTMQHIVSKLGFRKVKDVIYGKWDGSEDFDADLFVYRTYDKMNPCSLFKNV